MLGAKEVHVLRVDGMTCMNCVGHVTRALEDVKGVKKAHVSLEECRAEVITKAGVDPAALLQAVASAGYGATEAS